MKQMPPHFFATSNENLKSLNTKSSPLSPSSASTLTLPSSSSSIYQVYLNTSVSNNSNTNNETISNRSRSSSDNNSTSPSSLGGGGVEVEHINNTLINNQNLTSTPDINSEQNLTDFFNCEDLISENMESLNYQLEEILNDEAYNEMLKNPHLQMQSFTDFTTENVNSYNFMSTSTPHLNIAQSQYDNQLQTSTHSPINLSEIKQEKFNIFNPNEEDTESSFSYSSESNSQQQPLIKTLINNRNGKTTVEKHYGPITVRPRRNPAPTLASGRKSKYTSLSADEEMKREVRRRRNRQAAEKCKSKRAEIEFKLEDDLKLLVNEEKNLKFEHDFLISEKLKLEQLLSSHLMEVNCASVSLSNAKPVEQPSVQMPNSYNENNNFQYLYINNQTNNVNNQQQILSNEYSMNNDFNYNYMQQNSQQQSSYNQLNLQQQQFASQPQSYLYDNSTHHQWR